MIYYDYYIFIESEEKNKIKLAIFTLATEASENICPGRVHRRVQC